MYKRQVEDFLSLQITAEPEPITREEVTVRLVELVPRKAPGPDGVSNAALTRLPEQGVLFLVALLNACLRLAYFPQKWRKATVIVIPKQGKDASRPDNLRPISQLQPRQRSSNVLYNGES